MIARSIVPVARHDSCFITVHSNIDTIQMLSPLAVTDLGPSADLQVMPGCLAAAVCSAQLVLRGVACLALRSLSERMCEPQ
jgi:hypothetical protein